MTRRKLPHIVCFAPYTDWSIHSAREVTILQALRQRGCTVSYVVCDSAFSDCDLLQESMGAPARRPASACQVCQAHVATKLAAWDMPFRWLGRWMRPEDQKAAGAWVQSLLPAEYTTAVYNDWNIGEWVRSSVHTHLRVSTFDFEDPRVRGIFGSYLYSGLIAAFALDRLFEQEKPDVQLLFNGRMGPTRIALEFAKRRGIRTICEERAILPGRIMLYDDANCLDLRDIDALWSRWRNRPMTGEEVEEIGQVLDDRWRGRATDVSVFSRGLGGEDIYRALDFSRDRPLWALFTSSIDESADVPNVNGAFPTQEAWIIATVEYARSHPEIQLAIRVHPNVGSAKSLGRSAQDAAFYAALKPTLPTNVVLVASDSPLSSYGLAAAADLGLVWYSSIGLEMAAMGKRVIRAASYWLGNCDFIDAFAGPDAYPHLLERAARPMESGERREIAVRAWRFAHVWYLRQSIPFPLVRQPKWYVGEMAWKAAQELAPGTEPNLDRICAIFTDGAPVHPSHLLAREASADDEAAAVWRKVSAIA